MSEIYLNKLSSDNANWLSVRQALISGNIANANTPGFKAMDVKPMDENGVSFTIMMRTHENHLVSSSSDSNGIGIKQDDVWGVNHSGGSVSLPKEMIKAGEVAGAYQLNTSVIKSFHRMVISVFGA